MKDSKFFGCTLMLIGTVVGAGMLAMPTVSSSAGFIWLSALLLVLWVAATISGLLVLEVTMSLPSHSCSFNSMSKHTLGGVGKIITWISYLFLLYAVIVSYVIGGSSIVTSTLAALLNIEIPNWTSALLFTITLGVAVFWSTRAVDYLNRNLMSLKGILLIAALVSVTPYIEVTKLFSVRNISETKYLWAAFPTFLSSFCYHFIIPSLRVYMGDKVKELKKIIIIGNMVAVIFYLWWLACSFGVVSMTGVDSFFSILHVPSPGGLIQLIIKLVDNKLVTSCLNGFATVALTTAFLGVGLGLFDFLAEGFSRPNTKFGRLQTSGLTFIPPLIIALFFPGGFVIAINYASISVAILCFILPALMAFYLRKNKELESPYRAGCNTAGLVFIALVGVAAIVFAIMYILGLLPVLK